MQSVSSPLEVAILSPVRTLRHRVTIAWPNADPMDTNQLVTNVSINRQVNDAPDDLGRVAGGLSAQATVRLGGEYVNSAQQVVRASDLSPLLDKPWSTRNLPDYGIGLGLTIDAGFDVGAGSFEYVRKFTGFISSISPTSSGEVEITCLDRFDKIRGTVSIPSAGTFVADGQISPHAVEDLALRKGGLFLTPPRPLRPALAVSNCGSPLPEIGEYVEYPGAGFLPGYFVPMVQTTGGIKTNTPLPDNPWYVFEGWFRTARPSSGSKALLTAIGGGFNNWSTSITSDGQVRLRRGLTDIAFTAAGVFSNDTGWHYVAGAVSTSRAYLRVDGTTYDSGTVTSPSFVGVGSASISWSDVRAEGLQLFSALTFNPATDWNNGWTPNFARDITPTPARLNATVAQQAPDAKALIKEVTQAEGAIVGFDENGVYTRRTRGEWASKRFAEPVRTVTGDNVESWGIGWSAQGVRNTVQAQVTTPHTEIPLQPSGIAAPVWVATETYTCPARTLKKYQVSLDNPILDLDAAINSLSTQSPTRFTAVPAASVDDPAAVYITAGVRVWIQPTIAGIEISIQNVNNVDIALWTPESTILGIPAGPFLQVYGARIVVPEPVLLSVDSGSSKTEDLILPESTWRQDTASTMTLLQSLAADSALPTMILESVTIAGDPRIQLGDVVAVDDSKMLVDGQIVDNLHRMSDSPVACQVIGVSDEMPYDGMYKTILALRACYPPTGWILGVSGRSELGSTTLLVV